MSTKWQVVLPWVAAVRLFPKPGFSHPMGLDTEYLLSCGWAYGPGWYPNIWRLVEDEEAANAVLRSWLDD